MKKKLTINGKNYIFKRTELYFEGGVYKDVFANLKNNKTLHETINTKEYISLKQKVLDEYKKNLNMKLGLFLKQLKDNNDSFYKEFLNKYGDSKYSKFKIVDKELLSQKGLYIYCVNDELKYIGRTTTPFNERINGGYGNISPKKCYKDGRNTDCHINSLITKYKKEIRLFLLQLEDDTSIKEIEKDLIKKYLPEWNINKHLNLR
jgi:hypothetical protein